MKPAESTLNLEKVGVIQKEDFSMTGTRSKVFRVQCLRKKETYVKGAWGSRKPMSYFLPSLGDVDFFLFFQNPFIQLVK